MKFEPVNPETVNKLYKPAKLQTILDEFMRSDALAVRCVMAPGEYANASSAQSSYHAAIKRLRYPIAARVLNGDMYLIKINPAKEDNK
jgi:hypothetical protein